MSFEARPAAAADAAEVAALCHSFYEAHVPGAAPRETAEAILEWWKRYDLERDCRLLHDVSTGRLAAMGTLETAGGTMTLSVWIDPLLAGLGLGGTLAGWAEHEAAARGLATVRASHLAVDAAGERLLAARGYAYVRSVYVMRIDLVAPPPPPTWPDGCAISTLEPGEEGIFHEIVEEAFAKSWSHVPTGLDRWLVDARAQAPDPALWFLVRDLGEPVASAISSGVSGTGWIGNIAVRRAWRRRGLGRSLLLHSLGELHARGLTPIRLGVDATNETGAVRLYESAGMRVAMQRDFCERPAAR